MKLLWVFVAAATAISSSAQTVATAEPPSQADQIRELKIKLADWPQLKRYREENAARRTQQ